MEFEALNELAKLPYFRIQKGKLRLCSGVINNAIDSHTHLGWTFLLAKKLDLWANYPLKHFFPETGNRFDLDHHIMVDLSKKNRWYCRKEIMRGLVNSRGYSRTHTIPNLLAEMKAMGISQSVVLGIDWPRMSANSDNMLTSISKEKESRDKLIPFISMHPMMRRKANRLTDYQARGAVGVKLHPQMQLFRVTSRLAQPIFNLATNNSLPILIHTGQSPLMAPWQKRYGKTKDIVKMIKRWPKTKIILGHSGLDDYRTMVDLANNNEFVYLELSSQSIPNIKEIIKTADSHKILYGSDWPFYPMAISMARLLLATEGELNKYRDRILWENARDLLQIEELEL